MPNNNGFISKPYFIVLFVLSLGVSITSNAEVASNPVIDTCFVDESIDSLVLNGFMKTIRSNDPDLEITDFISNDHDWLNDQESQFVPSTDRNTTYWFKFIISNKSTDSTQLFLRCPNFHLIDLFCDRNEGDTIIHAGYYRAQQDLAYQGHTRYLSISLNPEETVIFYLKARFTNRVDNKGSKVFSLRSKLLAERDSAQIIQTALLERIWVASIMGFFLFFALFFLLSYLFLAREKSELYYSCYLFSVLLATLRDFERDAYINIIWSYFDMGAWYLEAEFIYLAILFYTLFLREFLNLKEIFPSTIHSGLVARHSHFLSIYLVEVLDCVGFFIDNH